MGVSFGKQSQFGSTTLKRANINLFPESIVGGEFGEITLRTVVTVGAVSFINNSAVGQPQVAAGNVNLTASAVMSGELFGSLVVRPGAVLVSTVGINQFEFGTASVQRMLELAQPASIPSSEEFGTIAVAPGVYTIRPFGFDSSEVSSPTVKRLLEIVETFSILSESEFGTIALQVGGINVNPNSIDEGFVSNPAVIRRLEFLNLPSIDPQLNFGVPTVAAAATIVAAVSVNDSAFGGNPTISTSYTVAASSINSQVDFGSAGVSVQEPPQSIVVDGVFEGEVGQPTLKQNQTLQAAAIASNVAIGSPTMNLIMQQLETVDASQMGTPVSVGLNSNTVFIRRVFIDSTLYPDRVYGPGELLFDVTVEFNVAVSVTGTPRLTLTCNGNSLSFSYRNGSGTTLIRFGPGSSTVTTLHPTNPGDLMTASALNLFGGTMRSTVGNVNANLTYNLPAVINNNIRIHIGTPQIHRIYLETATKPYVTANENIDFVVEFTEPITYLGGPRLVLNGTNQFLALVNSTVGTNAIRFRAVVPTSVAVNSTVIGQWLRVTSVTLAGGTIRRTGTSINANLTIASPGYVEFVGATVWRLLLTPPTLDRYSEFPTYHRVVSNQEVTTMSIQEGEIMGTDHVVTVDGGGPPFDPLNDPFDLSSIATIRPSMLPRLSAFNNEIWKDLAKTDPTVETNQLTGEFIGADIVVAVITCPFTSKDFIINDEFNNYRLDYDAGTIYTLGTKWALNSNSDQARLSCNYSSAASQDLVRPCTIFMALNTDFISHGTEFRFLLFQANSIKILVGNGALNINGNNPVISGLADYTNYLLRIEFTPTDINCFIYTNNVDAPMTGTFANSDALHEVIGPNNVTHLFLTYGETFSDPDFSGGVQGSFNGPIYAFIPYNSILSGSDVTAIVDYMFGTVIPPS